MTLQDVYVQAPLVTDRREIRILALASGTGDDVLRGDLVVESLNYDDLDYTALSYTWSGPVSESAIVIGDVPLHITENLELALHRIRGRSRLKNLWIDAICINQDATLALVWLDQKSADSDVAMDFTGSPRQRIPDQVDKIPLPAVTKLMRRTWWTRIWVVQEASMSRRIIVQCGERQVDTLCFVQLVNGKNFERPFFMEDEPEEPHLAVRRVRPDVTYRMSQMKDKLGESENPPKQPCVGALSNWYAHKQQLEASGPSLMELRFLMHGFQASVRRDKIFALLELATPEARFSIIPDYSDAMSDRLFLTRLRRYFLHFSLQPLRLAYHCRANDCPS